jgi:hypothetical protein
MEKIAFAAMFISLPVLFIAVLWGFYFYWSKPARRLKDQTRYSPP